MATITSLGTGSGLDLEGLVTKLMAVESQPLTALQKKQSAYSTKISAMGQLSSVLSTLQTAATKMETAINQSATAKFTAYTATIAKTDVASATASTGAVAGNYSLEVTQLAAAQQIKGSEYTAGETDGTLTLELGSVSGSTYTTKSTFNITIAAHSTLEQARDAINNKSTGVTASIIKDKDGVQQLVLASKEGLDNVMKLSGDVAGLDYDPTGSSNVNFSEIVPAKDATFKLNGIESSSSSNTVTDVLDGVTLNLTATNEGTPTTLKITGDITAGITSALQAFITAYNAANTSMHTLGAYNADTKVAGTLQGNSTLRTAMSQIRSTLFTANSGSGSSAYQSLSNIGVSVGADGSLSLDPTKLNTAITADGGTVASLVANAGKAFDTTIGKLIGSEGYVTSATNGLNQSVKDNQKSQDNLQTRLTAIEARYRAQFSALDTLIANLKTTGSYITDYISSLNNSSKN